MNNKIITILLIAAIVISVFSLIITLNLNTDEMQQMTGIKEPDVNSGEVGFIVESTSKNQNE